MTPSSRPCEACEDYEEDGSSVRKVTMAYNGTLLLQSHHALIADLRLRISKGEDCCNQIVSERDALRSQLEEARK